MAKKYGYEAYLEDQKKREEEAKKGQIRYVEAAKASRVQYALPQYQGKSDKQGKTYNWERELLADQKIKGAGNSYNKKFDALVSSMGMTEGQASEFRKYLDFQEDSQSVKPKMNKDGKINQSQYLKYARDSQLKTNVVDGILKNMTAEGKQGVLNENARNAKKAQEETKKVKKSVNSTATTQTPTTDYTEANKAIQAMQNNPSGKYDEANAAIRAMQENPSLVDDRSALDKIMDVLNAPLKAIDKNVLRPAERLATSFTDGLVGGQLKKNTDKFDESMTPEFVQQASEEPTTGAEKAIDFTGELAGMTAPIGLAYKPAGAIAKSLASTKYGQAAVRGGTAMGLYSGAQQGVDELTNPEDGNFTTRTQEVLLNAGLGAVGDPALLLAGAGLKAGAQNVLGRMAKVDGEIPTYTGQASDNVLDSLVPNQQGNIGNYTDVYDELLKQANPGVREAGEAITNAQAQKQQLEDAFVRQNLYNPKGPNPNQISGVPGLEAAVREQFSRTPQARQIDDLINQLTGQRESALNAPAGQPPKINDWQANAQKPAPVSMENITPRTDIPINNWQDNIVKNSQAPEEVLEALTRPESNPAVPKRPSEQEFIDTELAPFREAAEKQSQARQTWETVVKGAQKDAQRIKDYYGKIVPDGNSKDMINEIPPQFRAAKSGKGNDIYSFAQEEGFSSADEAIAYLKQIDADSKMKLKDLTPEDNMVLSAEEWDILETVARQKYAELHGAEKAATSPEEILEDLVPTGNKTQQVDDILESVNPKAETEAISPAPASGDNAAGSEFVPPRMNLQQHSTPSDISWVADTPGPLDGVTRKTVTQAAKTQVTSDLQFVKDMMRDIADKDMGATLSMMGKKGKDVAFEDNLFKGLRSVRRSISEAMKASKDDYGGLMKELKKNKITKRDFDEYVSAVHFQDVLTNNRAKSIREGEVSARLEEIEALRQGTTVKKEIAALDKEEIALLKEKDALEPYKLPREATPTAIAEVLNKWKGNATMESAQKVFMEAQRKDLYMQVESGLTSQAAAEAMIKAHPNYIYMGRAKEGGASFGASGNISKAQQHIKKRGEGSGEQLKLTPLDSAVRNRVLTYHNASRNNAMKTIEKLAVANGGDQYFAKLNPNAASNTEKANTVKFFKDGKAELYEVPPVLKQAFDSLDEKAAKNLADRTIRAASNMIRKGGTYYNLDFIFTSPARETNSLITSRTGLHPGQLVLGYMDSFFGKGLEKASGGKFKSYRESYEKMGGHQTGIVTQDPQSLREFTKAMNKGGWGKGFEMINPLEWISKVGGLVEHGPKLGEFRSAKGKGYSDKDAMHEAVDVIDYTDLGKTTRVVNKYVPFAGPMVRGTTRYFQAAKENPGAWLGKNLTYVTAPTVAIYSMRFAPWTTDEQRSKMRNMTEWQKNLTWSIPAPDGKTIYSVPKMHVGAQLFANPVERILDNMYNEDPKSIPRLLKDTGKDLGGVLTPPNSVAGVQLIMDSMANYNRLMDMPIEDLAMQNNPDKEENYNVYTSELAKGLGKITNSSPAKIDYLLKGLTAGTGRDALDLSDNILASLGVDRPTKIDTSVDILNPVRRYQYKDTNGTGTYNRLYKQQLRDEKDGIESEAGRLYEEMKALNKEVKGIRESKKLSSQEKKEAIAALREQQRVIGDEAIKSGILKNR